MPLGLRLVTVIFLLLFFMFIQFGLFAVFHRALLFGVFIIMLYFLRVNGHAKTFQWTTVSVLFRELHLY